MDRSLMGGRLPMLFFLVITSEDSDACLSLRQVFPRGVKFLVFLKHLKVLSNGIIF